MREEGDRHSEFSHRTAILLAGFITAVPDVIQRTRGEEGGEGCVYVWVCVCVCV